MLAIDALERDYSTVLLAAHEPPCLSLYQPTHRVHPDNQQDPIRFRNLVKTLEASLGHTNPADTAGAPQTSRRMRLWHVIAAGDS